MTRDKSSGASSQTPVIQHRASVSYTTQFRNRLAEQEKSPMNQTFAIGEKRIGRQRSNSIDSEIAEYTIQDAIAGRLPQPRCGTKSSSQSWSNRSIRNKSLTNNSLHRVYTSKLPSLEGVAANRNCCQKLWTQTQQDLQQYKLPLLSK